MIQTAQVGIGIEGLEGNQAAYFSDYSVPQFKGLRRLLLWHGTSYARKAYSAYYPVNVYKGTLIFIANFYQNMFNGFSGLNIFDHYYLKLFNVIITTFCFLLFQIFDYDV